MTIEKILVKNFKLLKDVTIPCNPQINIFVGENDSGKSTMLEVLSIITSGKLNGQPFERQLKANMFNDSCRREYIASLGTESPLEPPIIIMEAYGDFDDEKYSGTNNELRENCSGIRVEVRIRQEYTGKYLEMLQNDSIYDIPIEFYGAVFTYFSGDVVLYRWSPVKSAFIDTTRKDYGYIMDRFVADSISNYLSSQEQTDLSSAFRNNRHAFQENEVVKRLNQTVRKNSVIDTRPLTIDLKEPTADEWKSQMSVIVADTPFEQVGFGTQNTIKVELALKRSSDQINVVLMEEPENNLSFTNMAKLIDHVVETTEKQVFISTHSSYVANKLDLGNLFLVRCGEITAFNQLPDNTQKYFKKLPGYDTLRLVLAEKVILVEGPTDELIIQRAYKDVHGNLPINDGIDVIVVDSLAFKRYCDIAIALKKKAVIVTDNDGSISASIHAKYADYIDSPYLVFLYETDEALNTIEPSLLAVNCESDEPSLHFRQIISLNGSMLNKSKEEILSFMKSNKAEWAFRVFDAEDSIVYPEYIKNAIKQFD